MTPRPKMDQELIAINDKVTEMTEEIEQAIVDSLRAIKEKDMDLARAIIDNDEKIDDMDDEINEMCYLFLATQQPLAGDLRYCISIMKMVTDLERIGDHCEDLAKYAIRMENEEYYKELIDLPRMAEMAAGMVKNAIRAFLDRDLKLARKVWKADEEVDELFRDVYEEQIGIAATDSKNARLSIMFAFVAAHLERIADYATNICEETVFSLEGAYTME
ncbi:phosphate signaling complex protein PhoU [Ihubacter massiliensis]|uniref:Phosphate-specific transport system accessory protein PhoU n=1 Tax=Hominibacterium faecale TaxID=2839743 RepID=A0A9J6QTU4_9FIRM|nr:MULTISPECIES: phosphate signaling complex protein PhoU [Eubacteriales Family XIII. Incertae Sedis]MCO7123513.1 phosphate signaling complex protein PhoU [Ihubacter massiliensis]MCU7379573.1 phosphate signaling complex protein PhoU [Hominibacterium faecale]